MWLIALVNAIGLAGGFLLNRFTAVVVFGASFLYFSFILAPLTWRIYEADSHLVNLAGRANMRIANVLTNASLLFLVYFLIYQHFDMTCVVVSAFCILLCTFFRMNTRHSKSSNTICKNHVLLLFVVLAEFLLSILLLF